MYIKLNFTTDKPLNFIFRIVNEIINTSGITSVATLSSTATAGSWWSTLLSGLDTANSEIIRTGTGVTGLTTNTVSRYCKNGSGTTYTDEHAWTLEFSRYDDTTKKYYVQFANTGGEGSYLSTVKLADGLASGTLSSATSMAISQAALANTTNGTVPSFNSSLYTSTASSAAGNGTGFSTVRSFTLYLSDTALVWCASVTTGTTYNVGFGNTYSDSSKFIGPFIFSQYTRFDYTNTNANGITPLMFTNMSRGSGIGFGGSTNDWASIENTQYNTTSNAIAFRVFNLINSYPTTTASFPVVNQPYVNWGIGSRYSDYDALTAKATGSATVLTSTAYGPAIFTTTSTRFPSADLKTQTYGMLPVSWRHLYYYNAGGDASAKGGWYCFNGDYYPGDEFTTGGKTYKILPTWTGYSQRVGIAIPKE